jgi:hypothetical protein
MSYTNIEYVDSLKRWEMSVKLFKDDFGDELSRLYGMELMHDDILNTEAEGFFSKYLSENFVLQINEEIIESDSLKYEGTKMNFEAVWLNYSFINNDIPKFIKVRNKLMFGLFQDQKNLLIFNYKGKQKAFQFRHNKPDIEFEID